MSLNSVLSVLGERGLRIEVLPDGSPAVRGRRAKEELTDALREALAVYRDEILEQFKPRLRREFLFPCGTVLLACTHLSDKDFPPAAWYWRWEGEADWWPIPGRTWLGGLTYRQVEHGDASNRVLGCGRLD